MRICSPQLGLSPKSILGGEIYDREILKGLAQIGFEVDILLPRGKPYSNVRNWHITTVPVEHIFPPHLFNFFILPYLVSLYRKRPFDILRVHAPTFVGLGASLFEKFHSRISLIGVYHFLGEGGWAESLVNPYLTKKFSAIITDSQYMRKKIINNFNCSEDKIFAIHNGVDSSLKLLPKPRALIRRLRLENKTILLFMGLFIDRKNPLFLVRVMHYFRQRGIQVGLILCGRGALKSVLQREIDRLGLGDVIVFHDPVFKKEKNELMAAADIFVHPAKEEGFPLVIIESMVAGLPVVVTDGFSASEAVVHGRTGYLARQDDLDDWISKIYHLLKNESLRKKMARTAHTLAKRKFQWSIAAKRTAEVFRLVKSQKKILFTQETQF